MRFAITVGQTRSHPVPAGVGGIWRCGRFFPVGTTVVEAVDGEAPKVSVLVPGSLRADHTEQRPDPRRLSFAELVELSNDLRLVVAPLDELADPPRRVTTGRGVGRP